jgi:hypothetical protein
VLLRCLRAAESSDASHRSAHPPPDSSSPPQEGAGDQSHQFSQMGGVTHYRSSRALVMHPASDHHSRVRRTACKGYYTVVKVTLQRCHPCPTHLM